MAEPLHSNCAKLYEAQGLYPSYWDISWKDSRPFIISQKELYRYFIWDTKKYFLKVLNAFLPVAVHALALPTLKFKKKRLYN